MRFNPVFINATTLDDCWFKLLYSLNENGRRYLITEGSYKGAYRLAFDDVSGFINYPHQRPLAPIVPERILTPTNDEDIEKYFIEYLMDGYIKDNEDYKYGTWIVGGKYNPPIFNGENLDITIKDEEEMDIFVPNQLEWIIKHFKEKGFGNEHCYLTVGYPESNFAYDIPYTNEQGRKTSPCLRGLDFRIISEDIWICEKCNSQYNEETTICNKEHSGLICINKTTKIKKSYLLTKVVYRSWDLFSGFPVNMGGFTLLNEYVASELGIEPGPLSFTCKSLHCYDFEIVPMLIRLNMKEK